MNRKSSLRTAAASSAAVLETSASANSQNMNAPEHTKSLVASQKPVEVCLADPGAAVYWEDPRVEVFVRLEEMFPGDPGELSGAVLRISENGRTQTFERRSATFCNRMAAKVFTLSDISRSKS